MTPLLVRLRLAAEADIQEASEWYEDREPGLGGRFLDELGSTFTKIRLSPLQFPRIARSLRRALLRRFPYTIYFVLSDDVSVAVVAVLHQRRKPGIWKQRLQLEDGG